MRTALPTGSNDETAKTAARASHTGCGRAQASDWARNPAAGSTVSRRASDSAAIANGDR
jgi:hypothetical protein